jgi:hypothetical protein
LPYFGHKMALALAEDKGGVPMTEIFADGYRGLSLMVDLTLDRLLVPVAIVVALVGAYLIGVQLAEMGLPTVPTPHRL